MAVPFPMDAEFFAGLPVMSASFDLGEAMQFSGRTAGGAVMTAGLGARLWTGSVSLSPMLPAAAEAIRAKLSVLREPGRSLFVRPCPASHRAARMGLTGVTISALAANGRELRLAGLPSGFVLRAGSPLSFQYGTNPARYAFHRVVSDVVIGSGASPMIEVTPAIRPGAAVGATVQVSKPFFKAIILPGSVSAGSAARPYVSGISFDIQQTLR
ncbi:hypothetical protein [Falsirhodobacter halotolerans]|uniref:hypothetical protein n=1 Tax=Falsirhodobacter halotolerans TaxID=1146892 RepID=UPI001FD3D963|nr:hypothetical protein [Falsirhodobacter halotolerans]MCJ8138609.1 hypothetical protein [Falsirhodobacter halotolerans]